MFRLFHRTTKPEDLDRKLVFSLAPRRVPRLKQLRILPKILNPYEQWIIRVACAIILLASVVLLSRFARAHLVPIPQEGGRYREAAVGSPRLINPLLAASDVDRDLSRLIYAGLLSYNEKGELTGDMAREFAVEGNGQSIRFTLREGLLWHDGTKLTAQDVKFTIEAAKNEAWRSPLWRTFKDVEVSVAEPNQVIVRSKAFTASFPHLFTVGIIPKHIWENVDPQGARLAVWNIKPVGSGPFQFKSLTKSRDGSIRAYKLARFEYYHGGRPYLKEIVLRFFPDFESAVSALREHTVEGVSFIPERLRPRVPAGGVRVIKAQFPRFTVLFFQDRKSDALKEKAVRRALAAVLDRRALAALLPDARPATAPFIEGQVGFVKTAAVPAGDLQEARRILQEAGWQKREEEWVKSGKKLAVTLTVLDEPIYLALADAIKKAWGELGVLVSLEAVSRLSFEHDVLRPRSFEALLFSIVTGSDPDPYPFWHSSQADDPGFALSSVRLRTIDAAVEQGRATPHPTSRFRRYLEFQEALAKDVPGIVLTVSPYVYAVSKQLRGIDLEAMTTPADRLNGAARWFMRSRPGWK